MTTSPVSDQTRSSPTFAATRGARRRRRRFPLRLERAEAGGPGASGARGPGDVTPRKRVATRTTRRPAGRQRTTRGRGAIPSLRHLVGTVRPRWSQLPSIAKPGRGTRIAPSAVQALGVDGPSRSIPVHPDRATREPELEQRTSAMKHLTQAYEGGAAAGVAAWAVALRSKAVFSDRDRSGASCNRRSR